MDMSTQVPTVWNQLAETMYLKDSPTAEVWLSERASFSFGRFRSSEGLPEVARPVVGERGYIVVLQLKAIPFIEQFLGNKKVSSGSYPIGGVSAIDLQEEPAVLLPNPFDALVLYVTQAALDEVAYAHQAPRVERLVWPHGAFDPVVHHLGKPSSLRWSSPVTLRRFSWTMSCMPCTATLSARMAAWQFLLRNFGVGSRLRRCEEQQSYWRLIWTAISPSSRLRKHANFQ